MFNLFKKARKYDELLKENQTLLDEKEFFQRVIRSLEDKLEESYKKNEEKFVIESSEGDKVLFDIDVQEGNIEPSMSIREETVDWLIENDLIKEDQVNDQTAQSLAVLLLTYHTVGKMLEDLKVINYH